MSKEVTKSAIPDSVEGAAQAWRVTAVLQLVLSALTLATYWQQPELLGAVAAKQNFPALTEDQLDAVAKASVVIAFVVAIALCAVFFAIIARMRSGSAFSRALLVIGTVYLAVSAAVSFFSAGVNAAVTSDTAVLVSGGVRIVSATAAVAAAVLVASSEAKKYFKDRGSPRPGVPNPLQPQNPQQPQYPIDNPADKEPKQ